MEIICAIFIIALIVSLISIIKIINDIEKHIQELNYEIENIKRKIYQLHDDMK